MWIRRSVSVVAVGIVSIALAACTQNSDPSPSRSFAPEVTEAASTPEQWGAVAGEQQSEWRLWEENWQLAECGDIADVSDASVDCVVSVFTAVDISETGAALWQGLTTPGHSQFISTVPPQEVADLVGPTADSAARAAAAGVEWSNAGCGQEVEADCVDLSGAFDAALTEYRAALAAWEPFMP